jgi:hypothetical protein
MSQIFGGGGIDYKARLIELLSFSDATLSGTPKIIRAVNGGTYYYAKVYPTISIESGATNDSFTPDNIYTLNDATLSGTPLTVYYQTNSENHFFQMYPTISASVSYAGTLDAKPNFTLVKIISGTPRIAKFLINNVPYYMKIYPNKI